MSRYKKHSKPSPETHDEANKIARATQKPGQTKEQTKLITQGIKNGIDLYKKQQKIKAREHDKLRHRQSRNQPDHANPDLQNPDEIRPIKNRLPWVLLLITWLMIALYLAYTWY